MFRLLHELEQFFQIPTTRGVYSLVRPKRKRVLSRKSYERDKKDARQFILNKLTLLNGEYNFIYNRVAIRNQRSRWGSCSKKGNLNFNYRILHLPERLADYIIVHELCHLKELNHGKTFWKLVAKTIPDHKERRKQLALITRNQPLS